MIVDPDALFIGGATILDNEGNNFFEEPLFKSLTGIIWDHLPKFLPEDETSLEECITAAFARAKFEAMLVTEDYEGFDWDKLHREDEESYRENKNFLEKYQERLKNIYEAEVYRNEMDIFGKLKLLNYLSLCTDEVIFSYSSFNWASAKSEDQESYKENYLYLSRYISRTRDVHFEARRGEYLKILSGHIENIQEAMGKKFFPFVTPIHHSIETESILKARREFHSVNYERVNELQDNLNSMIGLDTVKSRISALVSEITIRRERESHKLPISNRSYHMVFTGNAGTGKTVVARIIAKLFYALGFTKKDIFVEATRGDLVAGYIGHTAIKTNEVIDNALGGVLFIDEAYALKGEGNDFGYEAITTLLKRMEDERDNLIVIIAGYEMEMDELLNTNQGLHSRFSRKIHFDDYNNHELTEILKLNFKKNHYIIDEGVSNDFFNMIINVLSQDKAKFSNGRGVRNLFEKIIENQEVRLHQNGNIETLHREDLQLIKLEDVAKVI